MYNDRVPDRRDGSDRNLPDRPDRWRNGAFDFYDRVRSSLDSMMDELQTFGTWSGVVGPRGHEEYLGPAGPWRVHMDLQDRGDHYELALDVPGVDREDVNITVHDDHLLIEGQRQSQTREEREGILHSERSFGRFMRRVPLPTDVDPQGIHAHMENGVLEMSLPKSEAKRGRPLDIQ